MTDHDEVRLHGTAPTNPDTDGDGLTDFFEVTFGFDPRILSDPTTDSDSDGLTTLQEQGVGTDPNNSDTDGDGLSDGAEINLHGTGPQNPDTDGGGQSDGAEVAAGTDPLDPLDDAGEVTVVELISNGGFEAGEVGWSRANQTDSSGDWFLQSGTGSPLNNFSVPTPPEGTFAFMTDQSAQGSHALFQDVTIPPTASSAILTFQLFRNNQNGDFFSPDSLDFTVVPNQQFRVDILEPTAPEFSVGAGVLASLLQTRVGDAAQDGYRPLTFDLSAFIGRTIRLRFAEVDNQFFFNVGVDNVSLRATIPPATSGCVLAFEEDIGTSLDQSDDDFDFVAFTGLTFPFFDSTFTGVFVNSNGRLTFNTGDATFDESLTALTHQPHIALFFDDLNPGNPDPTGAIDVFVKQFADRVVVTYNQVPEFPSGGANTFQVTLCRDGRIVFAYRGMTARDAIVGISPGASALTERDVSAQAPFSTRGLEAIFEQFSGSGADGFDLDQRLVIFTPNNSNGSAGYSVQVSPFASTATDTDGDGLSNEDENLLGTDPNAADTDGDGLGDGAEINLHSTDPLRVDTDSHGVGDGAEVADGTDSLDPVNTMGILLVELVSDGGFEAGGSNWLTENQTGGSGDWFIQGGTGSPLNDFPVPVPPGGVSAIMTDQNGPGSHVLFQDITIPPTATVVMLGFDLFRDNRAADFFTPDTLDFTGAANQQLRIDIVDPTAPVLAVGTGVLASLLRTQPGDLLRDGYTPLTFDLTAFVGDTIRLRFAAVDNQSSFTVGVDNVHVLATIPSQQPQDTVVLTSAPMQIPAGFPRLRFAFNFLTDEMPGDDTFNDFAVARLRANGDIVATQILASMTAAVFGAAAGTGFANQTGFRTATFDVSALAGSNTPVILEISVRDVGNSTGPSAVAIDDVRLENDTGQVQGIANGGFEAGDFAPFTVAFAVVSDPRARVITGLGPVEPLEGNAMALLATEGTPFAVLAVPLDLVVQPNAIVGTGRQGVVREGK